jgi:hypothetical protein
VSLWRANLRVGETISQKKFQISSHYTIELAGPYFFRRSGETDWPGSRFYDSEAKEENGLPSGWATQRPSRLNRAARLGNSRRIGRCRVYIGRCLHCIHNLSKPQNANRAQQMRATLTRRKWASGVMSGSRPEGLIGAPIDGPLTLWNVCSRRLRGLGILMSVRSSLPWRQVCHQAGPVQ